MAKKILTLCMIHQHPKLLLGMKKRGFGQGRWNGFGGKLHEGESIETAAKREITEEVGIAIEEIEKRGIILFEFKDSGDILEVHIFNVSKFLGNPIESEEMKPQWFDTDKIPFEQMWSDDKHWVPIFLKGKKFRGNFLFDNEKSNTILDMKLNEVSELE
jgi:8-oxo-dGTP diphosphatase/2-hydroxy-dATP diphosphatase